LVELTLKVDTKLGRIYTRKDLLEDMPIINGEVGYIGNKLAGIIFPKGASYADVLQSLKAAILDIEHRAELESRK